MSDLIYPGEQDTGHYEPPQAAVVPGRGAETLYNDDLTTRTHKHPYYTDTTSTLLYANNDRITQDTLQPYNTEHNNDLTTRTQR